METGSGDSARHRGYELQLKQDGRRVSGYAFMAVQNGEGAEQGQEALPVEGTFDGKRLVLTFARRGRYPETDGKYVLQTEDDGVLRGRYSVAGVSGMVEGRRR
jgi:hypothetical protein